jgi:hypothetical protein
MRVCASSASCFPVVRIGDLQGDYDHSEARIAGPLTIRKTGPHSSKIGCRVVSLHRGPGTRPALLEILQIEHLAEEPGFEESAST